MLQVILRHKKNRKYLHFTKTEICLMIPNREGLHYIAVRKLSASLKGIMSKHDSDFYCLNCVHSFRTRNKSGSH